MINLTLNLISIERVHFILRVIHDFIAIILNFLIIIVEILSFFNINNKIIKNKTSILLKVSSTTENNNSFRNDLFYELF